MFAQSEQEVKALDSQSLMKRAHTKLLHTQWKFYKLTYPTCVYVYQTAPSFIEAADSSSQCLKPFNTVSRWISADIIVIVFKVATRVEAHLWKPHERRNEKNIVSRRVKESIQVLNWL